MAAVTVSKQGDGIAVVTLAKEPVNTMNLDFWKELLSTMETLEADKEVRAVIFQSGLKRSVFTAGLDIKELYAPATSQERQGEFWTTLSKALVKIYTTPMATAAAIKGQCPAGGCCLSLCCDYRVITEDGAMGLNEVQLGIPVPRYWIELFAATVGQRQAELLLEAGDMVPAARLQQLGMADAVVATVDGVLPAAQKEMQRWLKSPDSGRVATKQVLRGPLGQRWEAGIQEEAGQVWQSCSDPSTVKSLTKVLERLSGGGKKASKL